MNDRIKELEDQLAVLKNDTAYNRRKLRELENAQITLDNRMLAIDKELKAAKAKAARDGLFSSHAPQSAPSIKMTPVPEPSIITEPIEAEVTRPTSAPQPVPEQQDISLSQNAAVAPSIAGLSAEQNTPLQQNVPLQQNAPAPQPVSVQQPIQSQQPAQQPAQSGNTVYRVESARTAKKEKKDVERTIGRQIMGIAASILIFIGITLFAMLIIPNLTDSIKMAAMFIFSFALTAVGITLMIKQKGGDFGVILAACGMGSVYISLYVTAVYFKSLDDIPLYILLLLWIVFICVLSRYGSYLFHLIGVIGIVVSVFFSFHILDRYDLSKTIFLTAYFIIGSTAFLLTNKGQLKEYITDAMGILFSSLSLAVFIMTNLGSESKPAGIMLIVFMIAFIIYSMAFKFEDHHIAASVSSLIASLIYLPLFCYVISENGTLALTSLGTIVAVTMFYRFKDREEGSDFAVKAVWTSIFMLTLIIGWLSWDLVSEYMSVAPVLLAVVIYGFLAEDVYFTFCGMLVYLIYSFSFGESTAGEPRAFCLLAFTLAFAFVPHVLMHFKDCEYKKVNKLAYYILGLLSLFGCLTYYFNTFTDQAADIYYALYTDRIGGAVDEEAVAGLFCFVIIAVVNSVLSRTAFIKKEDDEEEIDMVMAIPLFAINFFMIMVGMIHMNIMKNAPGFKIIYLLVTLALLFVNLDRIKDFENPLADIYLGLRFNIFMLAALASFDVRNYIYSTCCFALALFGIIIGFLIKKKPMRIYFLVVTLLSVIKLVMYDITYDNSAMRAMSFIISGVLCLIISFVYQKADKKLGQIPEPAVTAQNPVQNSVQQSVQPMQQPVQPMQQPVQPMQQPVQQPIQSEQLEQPERHNEE